MIQADENHEMNRTVEKSKKPQHSPIFHDFGPFEKDPYRRQGQGYQKKTQGPQSGELRKRFNGIGSEIVVDGPPNYPLQRT